MDYFGNIKLTIVLIVSIIGILTPSDPAFSSSVSLTHEEQQWLSEHKTIRVSGPQAFPPFQFFNEEDEYVGMAADFLQYIAAQLGISVEYLPKTSWGKILELIQNKEIDVLSCAAFTKERSKYLLFSTPHITFPLVIISRKDAPEIRKMQDIEGMRIALKKKISTEASLNKSQIPFTPHYISSPKDAFKAVSLGQADIAIENLAAASYIIDQQGYTNLKIAAPTDFEDYALAIAIRKDWPIFQSIINKSLATISDQQHREIRQRWFSVRYEHGITYIDVLKWIAFSLLLSSVVIGTIILWNRRLVKEIEERKKIEVRLRESERKLSTLIGNLPGMAYRCRNENEWPMEFISDGCLDVTGYSPSEISKDSSIQYGDIIYPDDRQYVLETVQEGVKKNKHFEMEYRIVAKSGNTKWVWERGGVVSDIQTHDIYLEGFIADITQQKILADKLQQSQKMEAIGTLAGGIAHEFNNMLTIILGNNDLIMERAPLNSLTREFAETIRIASMRARDVVKQLLTFSRHDDAVNKVMDFKFVVQESMKLTRSSTPANIKIEQNLSADTYPVIGNDTQINQLLINLCNNAVDAMPEKGGIITIELLNETIDKRQTKHQTQVKPGQYVKLMVSDNGIGMDNKILDRIFEPYYTTKGIGKGTGIGMAVVHGIVERHGGEIIVDSKPGRGTTFTIFLPAHEGLIEQEIDERHILPVGDEYILYVDDEPSIAKLGKRLLESLGYTTESITDPEKALDMVRSDPNKFDLLITDMAMPNMTGDQLVIETLKIRQDMPTIICTGYSAKISKKEAANIGVCSYILKPINKSELAKMVRKVLDGAKRSNFVKP
ncbi:MAG: transporter substrate-binding domain-containing protein [Desulfobulbaceae bacterium]|nr:transporter substrate-binding domain-containing protein [Desulfobulbaceae bacterium]